MYTHRLISILMLTVFLSAFNIGGDSPHIPSKTENISLGLIGEVIPINETENETANPAVAYSDKSNHYLVVYEDNNTGDIKGRFIDAANGQLTGEEFDITSSVDEEFNPDVVYDPINRVFLVVYTSVKYLGNPTTLIPSDVELAIKGKLVEEPEPKNSVSINAPTVLDEFYIAGPDVAFVFANPKVAYNREDQEFLVVFTSGNHGWEELDMLKGQMLSSHPTLPVRLGPSTGFIIENTPGSYHSLDVAHSGKSSGEFLAVVAEADTPDAANATITSIEAFYLYGTYGSGGPRLDIHERVAPTNPLTKFCHDPVLAHDPTTNSYTVVFNYGNNKFNEEDWVVYGQRLKEIVSSTIDPLIGEPFPIETDSSKYSKYISPGITYSGPEDEMQVIYIGEEDVPGPNNDKNAIYVRTVAGTELGPRTLVRESQPDSGIYSAVIAGSKPASSIVVWDEDYDEEKTDILGQRIGTFNLTFLPSILQEE